MGAKSVLEIDVNDDKFQSFLEKFRDYQSAIGELPAAWREAAQGIGAGAKETEKAHVSSESMAQAFADGAASIASINTGLDRLNGNLEKANKTQSIFNKATSGAQKFLNGATKDAKSLAGHIKDATTNLISWGAIVGVFTGLVGAGGLFGLNRLAASTASQRFTTMGLGTTAGGLNSSAINYQSALGNPVATLGAIRDAQLDLSKRWQFSAMGIKNPDQDPAKLLPQMIRSARDIFVRNGSTLQGAEANGLTNFFSLDDLNRFKHMSDAEIDAMQKRAEKDTQQLQLSDQTQKQWQDFNIQLQRSGVSIENSFIRGLAPLAPQLERLSDAFSGAIDTVLKSPELGKWIDGLAGGIQKFGNYLASPEFKSDVDSFMSGVEKLARYIGRVIEFASGKISAADFFKGTSSMLSNEEVKDPSTGNSYVPGTDGDPHVWGWLKGVKHFFSNGTVTPVDSRPASVQDTGRTIADRFNNPTNLRAAEGYGTSMTKSGNFAVFPSLDEGILASTKQLQMYGQKGINNIHDIISKWAPSNENDTKSYIDHVVKNTGRGEYDKLNLNDPIVLAKLISAMSSKEGAGSRVSEGTVIRVYNNTGGNALVTSTQLGGYG